MIAIAASLSFAPVRGAAADDDADSESGAYDTQVPPGMELQQIGNKSSYKVVVPKGSSLRREGDLRIVEGTAEYAARKFVDYDAQLEKMAADIAALRSDVDDIKKALSDIQKVPLASTGE